MTEKSQAELLWRLEALERDSVSKAVYERDIREIHDDIAEIKDTQKWSMRLIITQFIALIVALVVFLVTQAPASL